MTTVILADDHPVYLIGLSRMLEKLGLDVVGEAAHGAEALEMIRETSPDLAVLDVKMPQADGFEILKVLKNQDLDVNVLLLSGYLDQESVYDALQNGAKGYVLKSASIEAIITAVQTVVNGGIALPPELHENLAQAISSRGERNPLTQREVEILTLVSEGLTSPAIGHKLFIEHGTVKMHLNHIYKKLGTEGRAAAVREAMHRGIVD